MKNYKIVVFVPVSHAEAVRAALGRAGAGRIGNYDYATFSVLGTGRFRPLEGATPAIGRPGKIEDVSEERIETVVSEDILENALGEIKKIHPYEEPVIDVYLLISPPSEGEGEIKRGKK